MTDPIARDPSDFARMMGWPDTRASRRRARRWIDRLEIGQRVGNKLIWTMAAFRKAAPVLREELVERGDIEY